MVNGSMNQSETVAYDWLRQKEDVEEDDIIRRNAKQTPDFIAEIDGVEKGFEVKRARGNSIVVHETQVEDIEKHNADIVVVKEGAVADCFAWTEHEDSDWDIKLQERNKGKPVWLSGQLLNYYEKHSRENESPNQFFKRTLLREDQGPEIDIYDYEQEIKEMVDDRIEHHKHR